MLTCGEYNKMYHQQQSKWYPQRCLLAHYEATFDFSRREIYLRILTYGYVIIMCK